MLVVMHQLLNTVLWVIDVDVILTGVVFDLVMPDVAAAVMAERVNQITTHLSSMKEN